MNLDIVQVSRHYAPLTDRGRSYEVPSHSCYIIVRRSTPSSWSWWIAMDKEGDNLVDGSGDAPTLPAALTAARAYLASHSIVWDSSSRYRWIEPFRPITRLRSTYRWNRRRRRVTRMPPAA